MCAPCVAGGQAKAEGKLDVSLELHKLCADPRTCTCQHSLAALLNLPKRLTETGIPAILETIPPVDTRGRAINAADSTDRPSE